MLTVNLSEFSRTMKISQEPSIASIEYWKSQFRKDAIAQSHAFKTDHIISLNQPLVDAELNINNAGHLHDLTSSPDAVRLKLQPIVKRVPRSHHPLHKAHLHQVFQRFYIHLSNDALDLHEPSPLFFIAVDIDLRVHGTIDKFEPSSFNTILQFCNVLETALASDSNRLVAMRCAPEQLAVSGAVFLAGAYMILRLRLPLADVQRAFDPLIAAYASTAAPRDAPAARLGVPVTHLRLRDCWAGLCKANELGWLDTDRPRGLEAGECGRNRDPMSPDVQELVPGRLVLLRGPRALPGGASWRDVTTGDGRPVEREFSPAHHVPALRRLGVVAVVRVNAPEYPADAFRAEGLAFADLPCPPDAPPPPDVAAKLLRILDAVPGAVAVHGGASLCRAATLAALYAMRRHGFTAREAAGWLRVVRPGSLTDPRLLDYLVGREPVLRRMSSAGGDLAARTLGGSGAALAAGLGGFGSSAGANADEGTAGRASTLNLAASAVLNPSKVCEVGQLVAEAVAEVDDRLRALKASNPRRGSGPPTLAGEGMTASAAARVAAAERGRRSLRGRGGALMWQSCPSLTADEGATGEDGGQGQATLLRFCADLLPLPTA